MTDQNAPARDGIEPFELAVPESQLDDLRLRLSLTRFPDQEIAGDWHQGVPLDAMKALARTGRDADVADPRLAGLDHRVPQGDRSADRSR